MKLEFKDACARIVNAGMGGGDKDASEYKKGGHVRDKRAKGGMADGGMAEVSDAMNLKKKAGGTVEKEINVFKKKTGGHVEKEINIFKDR